MAKQKTALALATLAAFCLTLGQPKAPAQTGAQPPPVIIAKLTLSRNGLTPGALFQEYVQAKIPAGFHLYGPGGATNAPFLLAGIEQNLPKGLEAETDWIAPKPKPGPDGTMIYTKTLELHRTLRIASDAESRTLNLTAEFHFQACNQKECFPADTLELATPLTIRAPAHP